MEKYRYLILKFQRWKLKNCAKRLNLLTGEVFADFFSGITIDDNLLKFFTKWNSQEYRVFKLNLYKKVNKKIIEINDYNRLILIETVLKYIDYKQSSFIELEQFNFKLTKYEKIKHLAFNNFFDFENYISRTKFFPYKKDVQIDKIKFLPEMNFDLFNLQGFRYGYMVSERLKEAIEQRGYTGMRFEYAHNIIKDV